MPKELHVPEAPAKHSSIAIGGVEITAQLARKGTGKALTALDVGLVWRTVFRYD
jgi:hypothetical protein